MNIGRFAGGRLLAASVLASSLAAPSAAQDTPPEPPASPGMFHLGPFYVTPRFRIYSLGVDTNVFYTAFDRRTDFIAHGGPGLEVVVPLHGALKLRAEGTLAYLYFARTASQRRLTGDGARPARVRRRTPHHRGSIFLHSLLRTGSGTRSTGAWPRTQQEAQADLRYKIGERFAIGVRATADRYDVDEDQEFFGADLRTNLTRDTYLGVTEMSYALTPKTSLIVEADYQADRFLLDDTRDTDSNRLGGGFAVDSRRRSSPAAPIAGARSIRVTSLPDADRIMPYANVDLTYHFGPRTRLTADVLPRRRVLRVRGRRRRSAHAHHRDLRRPAGEGPVAPARPAAACRRSRNCRATRPCSSRPRPKGSLTRPPQRPRARGRGRPRLRLLDPPAHRPVRRLRRPAVPDRDLGIEGLLLGGTVTFIPD